jgi:zona occludens toxin (predicted ATPase)
MVVLTRTNNIYKTEIGRETTVRKYTRRKCNCLGVGGAILLASFRGEKNSHLSFPMLKFKYSGMQIELFHSTKSGSAKQNMQCLLQNQRVQHLVHKILPLVTANPNESSSYNSSPIP